VGHHREPAHAVRRAVHQGEDQQLRHPGRGQQPGAGDYSTNGDGTPVIALSPAPNTNYAEGFLANPHNYWMQFIQDHWEDNDADEVAARADVEYDLGSGGWLSSLKAGVRFADREQKVRYSTYNWAPIAPAWSCNGPGFNIDNTQAAPIRRPAAIRNLQRLPGRHVGIRPPATTTTATCSERSDWYS
jgi:hypothetical protein